MRLLPPALALLALFQLPTHVTPDRHRFQYSRAITVATGAGPAACVTLDAFAYVHAQPALADLRLFSGPTEIPYALTLSETRPTTGPATILNRGLRGRHIVFDLRMPPRPYTHVDLDLNASNFLVTARVTGLNAPGAAGTLLGAFTLFDLTRQDLSRNTTLPLPESTFPFLHVDLEFLDPGHPVGLLSADILRAASVPPSRQAETLYTMVEETTQLTRRGRETIAAFQVPAHLPVERASFVIADDFFPNFSRPVAIRARAEGDAGAMREELSGQISRVKLTEQGHPIRYESLAIPATVGSNGQSGALIEVAVDNGDDPPLPIRAVRLDMRQRKLCFDAPDGPLDLLYGDSTLQPPVYDYGRLFNPTAPARAAQLHAELPNAFYEPAPIQRPSLIERHPVLLWIALLAVASILGVVAFFSSRRV